MKRYWIFVLLVVFVLVQVFTLNFPALNGDEAIYLLFRGQFESFFRQGVLPDLNPIIDYAGPLDFWLMGSLYAFLGLFPGVPVGAWMVRLLPLLAYWIGIALLYRELRARNFAWRNWLLLVAAVCPMAFVYSRCSFPHSFLLGTFSFLLAEVFRIERTGRVRWLTTAAVAGFSVETHTSAFFGLLVLFVPVLPALYRELRGHLARAIGAVLLFSLLAFPVLRNFPPPVSTEHELSPGVAFEIRNFANMISGRQPFEFMLGVDPAPDAILVLLLFFLFFVLLRQLRELWSSRKAGQGRLLLPLWITHALGAAFLLFMTYRGRTLTMIGHERYFIVLVPGWVLLQAHALSLFARERPARKVALASVFATLFLLRPAVPLFQFASQKDPSRIAAEWLETRCPADQCVAYAENFWNYWAIRYYTRDRIQVNVYDTNWKRVPIHPVDHREVAGCWFTPEFFPKEFREKIDIPAQAAGRKQVCFSGASGVTPKYK